MLDDHTVSELRELAARRGIRLASGLVKAEIVEILTDELVGLDALEDEQQDAPLPTPTIVSGDLALERRSARAWWCPFCGYAQTRRVTVCGSCAATLDELIVRR